MLEKELMEVALNGKDIPLCWRPDILERFIDLLSSDMCSPLIDDPFPISLGIVQAVAAPSDLEEEFRKL